MTAPSSLAHPPFALSIPSPNMLQSLSYLVLAICNHRFADHQGTECVFASFTASDGTIRMRLLKHSQALAENAASAFEFTCLARLQPSAVDDGQR